MPPPGTERGADPCEVGHSQCCASGPQGCPGLAMPGAGDTTAGGGDLEGGGGSGAGGRLADDPVACATPVPAGFGCEE